MTRQETLTAAFVAAIKAIGLETLKETDLFRCSVKQMKGKADG